MHGYYVNKILTPLPTLHHSCSGSIPLVELLAQHVVPSQARILPLQVQVSYCPYSSVALEPLLSQAHLLLKDLMSCPISSEICLSPCFCFNCCTSETSEAGSKLGGASENPPFFFKETEILPINV